MSDKFKVEAGFRKWSVRYNKLDACVEVNFNYHPGEMSIKLYDATSDELREIGIMFLKASED